MGSWDELCIICGICAYGGPLELFHHETYELNSLSNQISSEITSSNEGKAYEEVFTIIRDALFLSFPEDEGKLDYVPRYQWKPDGISDWSGFTKCVAIGHFNDPEGTGGPVFLRDAISVKVPNGREVEARRVRSYRSAWFEMVVNGIMAENEDGEMEEVKEETMSQISSKDDNPNFFVSEGCHHYIQAWLNLQGFPPRSHAFPSDPAPLTFDGEFYEVVNSQKAARDWSTGVLNRIDYDGITDTCRQWQSYFFPARRGSKHIARAIHDGLRGAHLFPSILRDCHAWMFMRPDVWPSPSDFSERPYFAIYSNGRKLKKTSFDLLPVELLFHILKEIQLTALLSLSSTCESLRSLLTAPDFLDHVVKEMITEGPLHWVLPVAGMPNELERATVTMGKWMTSVKTTSEAEGMTSGANTPILSAGFPRLSFIHSCFQSDSMMNRKRIWGQVKQYESLWKEYRMNGWEVDRFYDP